MRCPITSRKIKTASMAEPIDLEETKRFLDIDSSDTNDDAFIMNLIKASRDIFEDITDRRLIDQTWYLYLNDWPGNEEMADVDYMDEIEIPYPPLKTVTSIKYFSTAGVETIFAASNYHVDTSKEPGRIVLADGASWPTSTLRPSEGIQVEYVCGYGASYASVPPGIQIILKMIVQQWFNERSSFGKIPDGVKELINNYRIYYL